MHNSRTSVTRPARRALTLAGLSVAVAFAATGATATRALAAPVAVRAFALGGDSLASLGVVRGTTAAPEIDGVIDSLRGRSGKLRARFVAPARDLLLAVLERVLGDSAAHPGVYLLGDSAGERRPFSFITLLPFTTKSGGRVENYRVGFWPAERRRARAPEYENPAGFIRVTADNQDTQVSEHFRLRDFLTHDQQDVWPKYLVLREELVDKLELVIDDLRAHGVRVEQLRVMSGFRTPEYNQQGVGRGGRARDSRHQFGDAADVYVDNNGDGRMDDLNRDGRVDTRDAQVILDAVERVELAHPDLVGGAGRYRATRAHGPFAHVDVRGTRVRWRNG
ncbi:MAG: hypothetical protein ACJ79S_15520 [Gemmatimonadaceae bacterium]